MKRSELLGAPLGRLPGYASAAELRYTLTVAVSNYVAWADRPKILGSLGPQIRDGVGISLEGRRPNVDAVFDFMEAIGAL